jgi:hypothetical protein
VVGPGGLHSAQAGKEHCRRPQVALGEATFAEPTYTNAGVAGILRPSAGSEHTGRGTKTPWQISWQTQRQPLRSG